MTLLKQVTYVLLVVFLMGGASFIHSGCTQKTNDEDSVSSEDQISEGKQLAQKYCGTCHLPVSADMLDKEIWMNSVLPAMAPKLGIGVWNGNQYYPTDDISSQTPVSFTEWNKIAEYFEQEAPDSLKAAGPPVPLREGWSVFSFEKPDKAEYPAMTASTTLIKIDPKSGYIYTSDAVQNALIRWDRKLTSNKLIDFESPAVRMNFLSESNQWQSAVITTLGTMQATDVSQGVVQKIRIDPDTAESINVIASGLNRPLQSVKGDFNKDGLDDWVICEFGHNRGGLYVHVQEPDQSYTKKMIRGVPGAEDMVVEDFNGDGWLDLMVLFAYDDEGIWMFTNDKKGGFEAKNLLRFPPVFGSTSFELVDVNNDGLKDIIFTNGDNADFSPILKPYHGLRIFLNKGNYEFEEAWFYPINGATQAVVKDFDEDGDLDIATIAFFADFEHNPSESFIYFERVEGLDFIPHSLPISEEGRWIVMDAGDLDGDGDTDIALGNFSIAFMGKSDFKPAWDTQNPILLLVNNSR